MLEVLEAKFPSDNTQMKCPKRERKSPSESAKTELRAELAKMKFLSWRSQAKVWKRKAAMRTLLKLKSASKRPQAKDPGERYRGKYPSIRKFPSDLYQANDPRRLFPSECFKANDLKGKFPSGRS